MFKPEGFSEEIFKLRYAFTEEESWVEACERVARQMAMAESPDKVEKYTNRFKNALQRNLFVPGGRIWYNSGRPQPQLLNCFVLSDDLDSKEGWGNISKEMIVTSMQGGGCGIEFSSVRPKGAEIKGHKGEAPGPVELMKLVNNNGFPIRAGGARRVALMFSLDLDHTDVNEFLDAKLQKGELQLANVSVRSKETKKFIEAVQNDGNWELHWKGTYKKNIKARDLWKKIVTNAYNSAEPGFLNWELVESESNIHYIEKLATTNPCGEIALSPYDCCCLGHLVLPRFVTENGEVDWHLLAETAKTGVRFLDNVLTVNNYPLSEMKDKSHKLRRIGMGTTGLADMLAMLGYSYGDKKSIKFIDKLYRFISKAAYEASVLLAVEKGAFPLCDSKQHLKSGFMKRMPKKIRSMVEEHGIRNCAVLTQAPTGCQKPDTLLMTENGFLEIQELGDMDGGQWQNLDNVNIHQEDDISNASKFYVNGMAKTKKIILDSGIELESTHNHQYRIMYNGDYIWKRADELEIGDKIVSKIGGYNNSNNPKLKTEVEVHHNTRDIKFPEYVNKDLSFFLGLYFADGSNHEKGIRIACDINKDDYMKAVELSRKLFGIEPTLEDNKRGCLSVCLNSTKLLELFKVNGLLKQKSYEVEIPKIIRCSSVKSLKSFIDGYYFGDGHDEGGYRVFDTVSKKMAQQLMVVLRGLGINSKSRIMTKDDNHIGKRDVIRIREGSLYTLGKEDKLRYNKKELQEDYKMIKDFNNNLAIDYVKSIEDSYNMTVDIEVPYRNTYTANSIISHNTVSIISGNVSSGIEPMFAPAYERRYWDGDERKTELVFHPLFKKFMDEKKDVDHFKGSRDLNARQHMEVQKTIQKHVDNAVSKTINIPEDYPLEEVEKLWLEYLPYLKGTTFYRENTRGYVDENGILHEPPLVALSLEDAKSKYTEDVKTGKDDDDCPSGICSI